MPIAINLSTVVGEGLEHVTQKASPLLRDVTRALQKAEASMVQGLGRDVAHLATGGTKLSQHAAERLAVETLLNRAGLVYNAPTREWLFSRQAGTLLRTLHGFRLDSTGFLRLVKEVQHPAELDRIKAIADYVRARPWINPDLKTLQGFRAILPAGQTPSPEEWGAALHQVDTRFNRDYQLQLPWIMDAHTWTFEGHNGQAGDEGISYWLRRHDGHTFLAKVPPQTRRGVNERIGYALYTALGVKSNEVQFGQRDWLPLLTLHRRLPGDPVALNRVAADLGLDRADYRIGPWPYPADNIGTGPSTWNRPQAEAYQARIAPRLADPAVFDKLNFLAHITDDPDLKPGNILASVAGQTADGKPIYEISRIDFGIMMDGYKFRDLQRDLHLFETYLSTLVDPINAVHLRNIMLTMKQFASMGNEDLTTEIMQGLHRRGDGLEINLIEAQYEQQMRLRLVAKRDLVRTWLEQHPDLAHLGTSPGPEATPAVRD